MAKLKTYYARKAAGICTQCGKAPAVPGKVLCSDCSAERRAHTKRARVERVRDHRCAVCGGPLTGSRYYYYDCAACSERVGRLLKLRREYRKANGLCATCATPLTGADTGYVNCSACRTKKNLYERELSRIGQLLKIDRKI